MADQPAPRELLHELHRALVETCIAYLEATPVEKRSATYMELIRSVLRDNNVRADMTAAKDMLGSLQELRDTALPFH